MKERDSQPLIQTASGERAGRELTDSERLQCVKELRANQVTSKNAPMLVKNVDPSVLQGLSGGEQFDAIEIDIKDNKADNGFDIVVQLRRNGEHLPRVMMCLMQQNGTLLSLVEANVDRRVFKGDFSSIGIHGEAACFEFGGDEAASAERDASLGRFNRLLQLAVRTQERSLSRN